MIILKFINDFGYCDLFCALSFIISIIALIISIHTNKRELELKRYAIENEKEKREEERHAMIRLSSIEKPVYNNYMIVQIKNIGKCEATEIQITILSETSYYYGFDNDVPKMLKPNESREIGFHWSDNRFSIEYEVHWKDKAGQHIEKSEFRNTCRH